jgi:hypothetical protein
MSNPVLIPAAGGKEPDGRLVAHGGQSQLLDVVAALQSASGFSRCLDCRQQQRNQDADDRDDDQKLYQRKTMFHRRPSTAGW